MSERPYTVLSCAVSLDGYIAGACSQPLPLSNAADLDRVDAVRASCDAILVGANTVRHDNPRLLVRSPVRREARLARGKSSSPVKVTVTGRGDLDPTSSFFVTGDADKLVYCPTGGVGETRDRLGSLASVIDGGASLDLRRIREDLGRRGVRRLMVEGGQNILTQFLTAGLADELQLVVAPVFVGDSRSRRLVGDGEFPWTTSQRATLDEVRQLGDVVLLRYALSPRFSRSEDENT